MDGKYAAARYLRDIDIIFHLKMTSIKGFLACLYHRKVNFIERGLQAYNIDDIIVISRHLN